MFMDDLWPVVPFKSDSSKQRQPFRDWIEIQSKIETNHRQMIKNDCHPKSFPIICSIVFHFGLATQSIGLPRSRLSKYISAELVPGRQSVGVSHIDGIHLDGILDWNFLDESIHQ